MKIMKLFLTAGVLCASSLLMSSFTDSSYQKNNPAAPKGGSAWYDSSTDMSADGEVQPCEGDRFELNVFDQNDEQTLYNSYGYTRGDMHHVNKYQFDIKTVETFRGDVVKVMRVRYPDGDCYVLVILKTDDGDFLVNLGPVWYIDQNGLVVNEGDALQVRGSKVRMNGRFLIISSEIKKDGEVLKFRDGQGQPIWGTQPGGVKGYGGMSPNAPAYKKKYGDAYSNPNPSYNSNYSPRQAY